MSRRIADYGIHIGSMKRGPLNKITDVSGVRVGHATIDTDEHHTGVTVVMPRETNILLNKAVAACHVLNGYGKSAGLMQIDELGTLESPIALTNTLNVGLVLDALVDYTLERCAQDGVTPHSLNSVVCECNDGYMSNIAKRAVTREHVFEAIAAAERDFAEGAVGGGRGMRCHGLKGGIGSASRVMDLEGRTYTLGVLVQSNYGSLADLRIDGRPIGRAIDSKLHGDHDERGSIIIIMATDLPLTDRQIRRILRRANVGLARVGSFTGNGSGEVFVGFSTATTIRHDDKQAILSQALLNEDLMNLPFRAMAEATEEAVLNSLVCAESMIGYNGIMVHSLSDYLDELWQSPES